MFVLRACFLVYFWLSAWNALNNLDESSLLFKSSFGRFEKSFKETVGFDLPKNLSLENWSHMSEMVVKIIASIQLGLIGLSLLVWRRFTAVVGLLELLQTCIRLNVFRFGMETRLTDWEPLAIGIALFGASLILSQKTDEKRRKRKRRRRSFEREEETDEPETKK